MVILLVVLFSPFIILYSYEMEFKTYILNATLGGIL